MELFKDLIGQCVKKVLLRLDYAKIGFELPTGTLWYEVFGDCCSDSWVSDIMGLDVLIGHIVTRVEEKPTEDLGGPGDVVDGDHVIIYGYTFVSTKGYCDVLFRNNSNGCYGGWCEPALHPPGVFTEVSQAFSEHQIPES